MKGGEDKAFVVGSQSVDLRHFPSWSNTSLKMKEESNMEQFNLLILHWYCASGCYLQLCLS